MKHQCLGVLACAFALLSGGAVLADPTPAPSAPPSSVIPNIPGLPPGITNNPYVQSVINAVGGLLQSTNGNSAHGVVRYFRHFELQIETAPRVYRDVHLHQGTVINPRGTTLEPGMVVDVAGSAQSDGSLNADTITTK
jgi:hypothetical protein